jgi:hypothetical protein
MTSGAEPTNSAAYACIRSASAPGKPQLKSNVALRPSELREPFPKHSHARLRYRIVPSKSVHASDPPHPVRLLRAS